MNQHTLQIEQAILVMSACLRGLGTSRRPLMAARARQSASSGSLCAMTSLAAGWKKDLTSSSMLSRRRRTCFEDASMTCRGLGGAMISRFFT